MSEVLTTRMHWTDIAAVAALDRVCFGVDAWTQEYFWAQLAVPGNRLWVARAAAGDGAAGDGATGDRAAGDTVGQLAGYVGMGVSGPQGDILTLGVSPLYRGRGLGGQLLDVALGAASAAGVSAMYLDVRAGNVAAIRLYEARGFEVMDRRVGYYSGADALVMRAHITPAG